MVFIAAADAKPKVPHKHGRSCRSCGAKEASQWRGPSGDYCSCCTKEAKAAREALKTDDKDRRIGELIDRLEDAEECLAGQADELAGQAAMIFHLNEMVAAMQEQLRRLAKAGAPGHEERRPLAGTKRPALQDRSNMAPTATAAPPAKRAAAKPPAPAKAAHATVPTGGVVPPSITGHRREPAAAPQP
jgi:hypothetical protein